MAVHKAPNCLIQLLLLVWKNFSMLLGRKCYMMGLIIFFAIIPLILMSLRLIPLLRRKPQIRGPIPTFGLHGRIPSNIYFSPQAPLLEALVKEINGSKITAFQNSRKLQEALVDFPDENDVVIGIDFAEGWTEWPDQLSFVLRVPKLSASDDDMFGLFGSYSYYENGFLAVQQALSKAHINHKCKQLNKCPKEIKFPEFRDLPSPPIFATVYTNYLQTIGQFFIEMIACFVVVSLTKYIVQEKELQLKETLHLLGVGSGLQWLAWCLGINRAAPDVERSEVELIEADPEGKTVGVQIIGLSKTFGKMEAVRHISFDMFEDQITVLMGHNGAGKTTLISMLAGFIPPTSGTALVNGYDIQREPRQARRCIGLCPQQNVLFKHLSSASHIWFFSRLRGLRGAEVKAEVDKYLEQLNLKGKKKAAARNLSGGTQRRLSVACALCGGVKVLICDEPSTGLDPGARRELWKLILEAKKGCTVLLTTHQLDDGEVLSDRMVIISDGQVRCIGSLPFLKKQVDASCLLTCETRKRCDVDKLTSLISLHVGSIIPFSIMGRDVCYKLPLSKSISFSRMFRDLEHQKNDLKVRGFGMSSVGLEEIFMSFGEEERDSRNSGGAEKNDEADDDVENEDYDQEESEPNCGSQWRAMMIKKYLSFFENKVYFVLLLLIPIVYYLSTLISATDPQNLPRVSMNVQEYGSYGVSILVSDPERSGEMSPAYYTIARLAGTNVVVKTIDEPMEEYVKNAWATPEGKHEIMFMPMAVELASPLVGWVGPRHFLYAAPMTLNLVYNVMAHELLGPEIRLKVTSAPYQKRSTVLNLFIDDRTLRFQTYVMCYVGLAMILFSHLIIQERDSHMKMQQEVSGLSMVTYWLSHLVFDMLVYSILALALLLPLYNYAPWYNLLTLLLFLGLTSLIFVYFLTLVLSATLLAVTLVLLSGILAFYLIQLVGEQALIYNVIYIVICIAYLTPLVAGYYCLAKCFQFSTLCADSNFESEDPDLAFLKNVSCVNPMAVESAGCVCKNLMLYPEMLGMIAGAIIFWTIMMFYEYGSCIWYKFKGCCTPSPMGSIEDPKVAKEAEKIKNMDAEQIESRALVVEEVSKKYSCGPLAVNNISFALKPHFCLGLLGPNGAGKTSTFKMIVGEQSIDRGNIYIAGYSMKTNRRNAMKELGYCAQFDSFFEFFTGRQMVKFFLQLRGTESKKLKERSEQLADQFGFRKHLDKKIKYYSGGTKRKINAAVACGAKSLICLDEPSAGVDPASRRHVWNIIDETASKGKAVLLTSHNMDEINALCSKSVILVNGSIYAMGSNQHVKSKICNRLALKLVVNVKTDDMSRALIKIEDEVKNTFPKAILKENYEFSGRITFEIPEEDSSWSKVFDFVEGNRGPWQLVDYSIQQPSFEDIFEEIGKQRKFNKRTFI
uniref:ATP-binding cassette sub-family A member 3 isoform X2 n=1 Tax=Drosophila rhopaloa TaxID=1041015 RepID=A0A6P4ERS6_DRORH